jgi:hypothetical protein
MAQKVTVILEDDLTGGPAKHTVRFAFDGTGYEIDLNAKNAAAFGKQLASYPADFSVDYPQRLSRGLVLVKWWLLALPQLLIVAIFAGSWEFAGTRPGTSPAAWA